MLLSPHFTRRQLESSMLAERRGISNRVPDDQLFWWTKALVELVEPIYEQFPNFVLSSAYRCKELNSRLGGSRTSQHLGIWRGAYCAAFDIDAGTHNNDLANVIQKLHAEKVIRFDQQIFEMGQPDAAAWIHVSTVFGFVPRGQVLRKLAGQPYEQI